MIFDDRRGVMFISKSVLIRWWTSIYFSSDERRKGWTAATLRPFRYNQAIWSFSKFITSLSPQKKLLPFFGNNVYFDGKCWSAHIALIPDRDNYYLPKPPTLLLENFLSPNQSHSTPSSSSFIKAVGCFVLKIYSSTQGPLRGQDI